MTAAADVAAPARTVAQRALRPRDAATLLILDRGAGGQPRVLVGRRHHRHVFMPGMFVFPGGRVDPGDSRVAVTDDYEPAVAAKLMVDMRGPKTAARARAFGIAAVRETYEEAGLFVGARSAHSAPRGRGFEAFSERGLMPSLAPMRLVARAITPPGRPRRFDARFLAVWADAVVDRLPEGTGPSGELEELTWVGLDEALTLELPRITHVVLGELAARLVDDPELSPDWPAPFFSWRGQGFDRRVI